MEWIDFCDKVAIILGIAKEKINLMIDEEKINYTILEQEQIYSKEDFQRLKENTNNFDFLPFSIINNNKIETLIDSPGLDSRRQFSLNFEEKLTNLAIDDTENNISYFFSEASNELMYFILDSYDNRRNLNRLPYTILEKKCELQPEIDIFCLLRLTLRLPFSICVQSNNSSISQDKLIKYTSSYLFNLAYNIGLVFKIITEVNEVFPKRLLRNVRRIDNLDEIVAPRLNYIQELAEQYYMALASTDPFVMFIGFYHIMEYFYEDVYNEDILENVQHIIQHPGFSSKRKKDIVKVIDIVKKKTRQSKEEFQGSELEALELTIKKFIDISELINELSEFDSTIIEYYCNHEVSFSNGDAVDLRDTTNEKLIKKIAARIYKTRNSLVHSKSNTGRLNERGIYKPFKDNQELSKEIPLMRVIAETIIIASASPF